MVKKCKTITMLFMMCCFMLAGIIAVPNTAYAGKITKDSQVEKLANKKVPDAVILEIDRDYEEGNLVYEVKMMQGTKEYELKYLASDGTLIEYGWEENKLNRTSKKKIMSESECRKLANKKVSGGTITSIRLKYDDGIDQYKVKMNKGSTKYELKYHARTRKLIAYKWEKSIKNEQDNNNYIGVEKAKEIALSKVPGGIIIKAEFDRDDGMPVYEVELVKDKYEYEVIIHAETGKILEFDKDYRD